jgi:Lipocalin-like domain
VANDAARDAIVGLWRLVSYEDRENESQAWTRTDGEQPSGLAVYHSSGMLSVQLFGSPGSDSSAYHVGYIGTFSVREAHPDGNGFSGVVEHQMQSASDPELLALDVARQFSVSGDRLMLGDGHLWRRTFERVP